MVTSVHVSFSFVVLCGRSSRRRSREEPDREARPGTHEEMDDDDDEKAESLSNLNGLCLCAPTGLVEMMLGRLLGAKSSVSLVTLDLPGLPWVLVVTACLSLFAGTKVLVKSVSVETWST